MRITWKTRALRREEKKEWHSWFAWKPVRLIDDNHSLIWLERVERRLLFTYYADTKEIQYRQTEREEDKLIMGFIPSDGRSFLIGLLVLLVALF